MAEKSDQEIKSKLYSVFDFLSLIGTSAGLVAGVYGIMTKDNTMANYGITLFGLSISGHFIEAGLEKRVKKK